MIQAIVALVIINLFLVLVILMLIERPKFLKRRKSPPKERNVLIWQYNGLITVYTDSRSLQIHKSTKLYTHVEYDKMRPVILPTEEIERMKHNAWLESREIDNNLSE